MPVSKLSNLLAIKTILLLQQPPKGDTGDATITGPYGREIIDYDI